MQSFSYSLGMNILIYMLRLYLRLKVSNSRLKFLVFSSILFHFCFKISNSSLTSSLSIKTLLKSHGNAYLCDFFQPLPQSRIETRSALQVSRGQLCWMFCYGMTIDVYFLTTWNVLFLIVRWLCSKHQVAIQRPSSFQFMAPASPWVTRVISAQVCKEEN